MLMNTSLYPHNFVNTPKLPMASMLLLQSSHAHYLSGATDLYYGDVASMLQSPEMSPEATVSLVCSYHSFHLLAK